MGATRDVYARTCWAAALVVVFLCDCVAGSEDQGVKLASIMADWWNFTTAQIYGGQERAEELLSSEYGAMLSTGRVLSDGCPPDRLRDIEAWSRAPNPLRTKDYHGAYVNSDLWDQVSFRPDDIVICTTGKSGTTWTQGIVANLIFKGNLSALAEQSAGPTVFDASPRIDTRFLAKSVMAGLADRIQHRRFLKTHLPLDGVKFSHQVKYIWVVRDIRDAVWSYWSMLMGATPNFFKFFNEYPGRVGPPIPTVRDSNISARDILMSILDDTCCTRFGFWNFFHHFATWWQYRHLPNVLVLHFANMKRDHIGSIQQIAQFLGIEVTPALLETVREQTTLAWMREHKTDILSAGYDSMFEGNFFHKGHTGVYWRDELSKEDIRKYEAHAVDRLGEQAATFMMTGELQSEKAEL